MTSWRRPLETVEFKEVPEVHAKVGGEDQNGLLVVIPASEMPRLANGMVCGECTLPFPERPSKQSWLHILAECRPFAVDEATAKSRVYRGLCPHCGADMSAEAVFAFRRDVTDEYRLQDPDEVEPREWDSKLWKPRGVRRN